MDNKILVTWNDGKTVEFTKSFLSHAIINEHVVRVVEKETGRVLKPTAKATYKIGFKFEMARNKVTGVINGVTKAGLYNVIFFKNGNPFYMADVFERTLTTNLKTGMYKEV